jgi:hypothetical protein
MARALAFLIDPAAAVWWIGLSLLAYLVLRLLINVVWFSDRGFSQLAGVIYVFWLAAAGFIFAFLASVVGLVIVRDTAIGLEKVHEWPGLNFLDWTGEAFFVINSLFLSILPGVLLAHLAGYVAETAAGVVLVLGGLAAIVLFPLLLLSMVEAASILSPVSRRVWRSVRTLRREWTRFFGVSAALLVGGGAAFGLMILSCLLLDLFCAVAMVGMMLIYFRLLGQLMRRIVEQDPILERDSGASADGHDGGSPTSSP